MIRRKRVFASALLGLMLVSVCLGSIGLARCEESEGTPGGMPLFPSTDPPVIVFNPDTAYDAVNQTIEFSLAIPNSWFWSPGAVVIQTGTINSVNCIVDQQEVLYNDSTGVNYWENFYYQPADLFVSKSVQFTANVSALPVGMHTVQITVNASTVYGNYPFSWFYYDVSTGGTYSFTVIASWIAITDLSIQNKTYTSPVLPLVFSINQSASWIGYSLDNQAMVRIYGNSTLTGLTDGDHSIVIYADNLGNVGKSDIAFFAIDTTPPNISNLSIENKTYATTDVPLNFNTNENTSWLAYSLDNQANVTIDGNFTLSGLSEGTHNIVIYANDSAGNMGKSDTAFFTINTPTPSPSVPEFPTWIILPLVAAATLLTVFFIKRRNVPSRQSLPSS